MFSFEGLKKEEKKKHHLFSGCSQWRRGETDTVHRWEGRGELRPAGVWEAVLPVVLPTFKQPEPVAGSATSGLGGATLLARRQAPPLPQVHRLPLTCSGCFKALISLKG